ncbi:hypothetical protein Tco_0234160, partial [Tanacetum coccineum]
SGLIRSFQLKASAMKLPFQDGSEFYNYNLQAILANNVVSFLTLSDQGYAEDFYDQ